MLSYLMGVVRHAKSTQDNKYTISLKYLKKEVGDQIDFFHADKLQSFLQVDTISFNAFDQTGL